MSKKLSSYFSILIATALGAGLFPRIPGTMGSLVGLLVAYWNADQFWVARAGLWVILTLVGTWAAKVFDEGMGTHDNSHIVIDEVIGMGIAAWTSGRHPVDLIIAFLLFRFFDILKPYPVRQIDRWSKKGTAWIGGFGVIADDIAAGFQALIVMILLQFFHVIP